MGADNSEFRIRPPRAGGMGAEEYAASFRTALGVVTLTTEVIALPFEEVAETTGDAITAHTPVMGPEAGPTPEVG